MYKKIGLRCPFCGKEETLEFAHRGSYLAVECAIARGGCGARGPEAMKHGEAVQLWNNRTTERDADAESAHIDSNQTGNADGRKDEKKKKNLPKAGL